MENGNKKKYYKYVLKCNSWVNIGLNVNVTFYIWYLWIPQTQESLIFSGNVLYYIHFKADLKHIYRSILSSIVVEDTKPSWVPFGPFSDVVNFSIDDHPLVSLGAVALHILPGVNTSSFPAVRLSFLSLLASTSHPHCSLWPWSTCLLKDLSATKPETWKYKCRLTLH